jgi:hypothetical protein
MLGEVVEGDRGLSADRLLDLSPGNSRRADHISGAMAIDNNLSSELEETGVLFPVSSEAVLKLLDTRFSNSCMFPDLWDIIWCMMLPLVKSLSDSGRLGPDG